VNCALASKTEVSFGGPVEHIEFVGESRGMPRHDPLGVAPCEACHPRRGSLALDKGLSQDRNRTLHQSAHDLELHVPVVVMGKSELKQASWAAMVTRISSSDPVMG
jgi:hypothetical protein